jgi:hypothetical protein
VRRRFDVSRPIGGRRAGLMSRNVPRGPIEGVLVSDLPPYSSSAEPPMPYPTSGFQVPGGVPGYDVTLMGSDPLVTPPGEGFSGWWMRLWKTFARSWVSLLPIVALTSALPWAIAALLIAAPLHTMTTQLHAIQLADRDGLPRPDSPDITSSLTMINVYTGIFFLVFLILGTVGWVAGIWTMTKQAAGEPAPFGRALRYGLTEFPRTFGRVFVYFLLILIGAMACLLPGLYFAVAGCLVVPLSVFSRGSIGDSFRMVKSDFGAVLGRVLTLYAVYFLIAGISAAMSSALGGADDVSIVLATSLQMVGLILSIPPMILMIIGITLTFAEMRAREMPTSTELLNQAL